MSSNIPPILEELFLKNLKYFKIQNPSIYELVNQIKLEHTFINISDEGQISLTYKGRDIYGNDAIKYIEDEVDELLTTYQTGKTQRSITTPSPGLYSIPRFFQTHLNQTIIDMYKEAETVYTSTSHFDDRYDFMVITGIGLGLHISELLDRVEVQNLLIYESDYELLTISLFFTDWEEIYKKQNPKNGKSITIISIKSEDEDFEYGSLWNELIIRSPHFPFNTIFYNHGRHDKYGRFINKIKDDQKMYMSLWGHYDDESNQLNHIIHNVKNNGKWIPDSKSFKWDKPIAVCGSGPSLDDRIEQLKSIRDDVIIISAGTALSPLLKHGITPDFHMEIESDYNVYTALKALEKDDELRKITLISGIQTNPYVYTLFDKSYSYCKDSLSCRDILDNLENSLRDATPTCVNAALSFCFLYKAKEIYLFGTDFGFYDQSKHHSQHSIYHDNKNSVTKLIREISERDMNKNFKQPGYKGDCLTTDMYFTTKRRVEMSILYQKGIYEFNIFNCADGLIVRDTLHIDKNQIIKIKNKSEKSEFYKKTRTVQCNLKEKLNKELHKPIKDLFDLLISNLESMENNTIQLSSKIWSISNYLTTSFQNKNGNIYYFIRGTIWHYMLAGYSITYSCEKGQQEKVIKCWKKGFIDFLEKLPSDLKKNIDKERNEIESDNSLRKTITEK